MLIESKKSPEVIQRKKKWTIDLIRAAIEISHHKLEFDLFIFKWHFQLAYHISVSVSQLNRLIGISFMSLEFIYQFNHVFIVVHIEGIG